MLQNFRSYQLAKEIYQQSKGIRLRGEIRDQFERAMLSVVLNLAEGSGKTSPRERARFYGIALGSLREVQAIFDLSGEVSHFEKSNLLGAMIYRLIRKPA